MYSQAFVPQIITKYENQHLANLLSVFAGVCLLSALAQVVIPLPWTPVPITGQTFGVSLVALLWGWKRGGTAVLAYLFLGASGVGVFAAGSAGLSGATAGYLIGMFFSSLVVGQLADLGFTKNFLKTLFAAYVGSAITFVCGLFVLSFFLPSEGLLAAGLLPFLPGDLIKNTLAALIATKVSKS